ncbi:cupin domain-containing protein [Paenibacillus hubeiensis]|uniref:cupin domain-containing protein n=1 Tax=Paenibacillus hubeiensis TaxID=3077330 RepID=UPI0031BABAEB
MSHSREMTAEEASREGVKTYYEQMANGEKKYKMLGDDGSYYCRTAASSEGAWQNSHVHHQVTEHYFVQSGWIAYAACAEKDQAASVSILKAGDHVIVPPGVQHNVYMAPHSVIHTIKFGANTAGDWHASPELDQFTRNLTESELIGRFAER